jgi:hypothetical protein
VKVGDVAAAVRACKARDYAEEGIEMFLVLEDVTAVADPPAASAEGRALAALADNYLRRLRPDPGSVSANDLADVLEVLAAHHFDGR